MDVSEFRSRITIPTECMGAVVARGTGNMEDDWLTGWGGGIFRWGIAGQWNQE